MALWSLFYVPPFFLPQWKELLVGIFWSRVRAYDFG